jgi:hypothetical protein
MNRRVHRGGLVGPVILVSLGVVFLLTNFAVLPTSIWYVLLRAWPVLLIAIGVDLIIPRRTAWGSLLALVLILAVMAGGAWVSWTTSQTQISVSTQQVTESLDGATRATVSLEPAATSLHVSPLSGSDRLISGEVRLNAGETLQRNFDISNGTATLTLRSQGSWFTPALGPRGAGWDLRLNSGVTLDLTVNMGAGDCTLDLSGMTLDGLNVNTAVGLTTVTLPASGRFSADIEEAIGQIVVNIPDGMGARIQMDAGLAGRQVPPGYLQQDNVYTSPNYAVAANRVDLRVALAIGNVRVRHVTR